MFDAISKTPLMNKKRAVWGLTPGSFFAYENELGIIMLSTCAHEAQFLKNIHFPNEF